MLRPPIRHWLVNDIAANLENIQKLRLTNRSHVDLLIHVNNKVDDDNDKDDDDGDDDGNDGDDDGDVGDDGDGDDSDDESHDGC